MAGKKDLAGRRVLAVIAPAEFRDEELFVPKESLEARGASVTVASTEMGPVRGMLGKLAHPDCTIAGCAAGDFDAIAIVGGMGSPAHLWEHEGLHALLRDAAARGRVVAAICLSGAVLARAGVLAGKRATVYSTEQSLAALKSGGAHFTGVALEVDGAVITADGPAAARRFGEAIGDAIVAAHASAPAGARRG